MTRVRSLLMSVSVAAAMLGAVPGLAQGRPVTLVNSTTHTMVRFYVSAGGDAKASGGGTDMLGDRVLKPGQSARITVDNGDGTCNFDLRAEFDNGSKQSRAVDICSVATYRFGA